jgi:hypothetical protein
MKTEIDFGGLQYDVEKLSNLIAYQDDKLTEFFNLIKRISIVDEFDRSYSNNLMTILEALTHDIYDLASMQIQPVTNQLAEQEQAEIKPKG